SDEALEKVLKRFQTYESQNSQFSEITKRFITEDEETQKILRKIGSIKESSKAVLIQGPSGTGKTYLAQIIHDLTHPQEAPLVSLNCAQFNEMTIDSELFGHKKGSFTGATENKMGLIKMAEKGTLFLDEIHGLSPKAQLKLLTALDQGIIYPMGANKPEKVSFKIICATSENLEELVDRGYFREDLYFRIKTFILNLKGLKDRREDIFPLIMNEVSKGERKIYISPEAKTILKNYDWPGNVREIKDLVENWNIFGVGIVHKEDLPAKMIGSHLPSRVKAMDSKLFNENDLPEELFEMGMKEFLDKYKKVLLARTLEKYEGKQSVAAKALKISKSQMSKEVSRLRENGL
ncbi:MAG: sigma 54-interacting transcriptional regulator, partial [Halobacteriovoraceae bacterium]|nr:sigma 54-interacting transcriptional regulator [Halobacteriovoraceae bacterium]